MKWSPMYSLIFVVVTGLHFASSCASKGRPFRTLRGKAPLCISIGHSETQSYAVLKDFFEINPVEQKLVHS